MRTSGFKLAIPRIIGGGDTIAQAQSGTGKTGAFSISLLSKIDEKLDNIQSIVIVPTHELADQIFTVIKELSSYSNIRTIKLIGKTSINSNIQDLQNNPHVIVGIR